MIGISEIYKAFYLIQMLFPLPEENNQIFFDLGGIFPYFFGLVGFVFLQSFLYSDSLKV